MSRHPTLPGTRRHPLSDSTPTTLTLVLAAVCASSALLPAQWPATFQTYSIARLGLLGPDYTDSSGHHESVVTVHTADNRVAGRSKRVALLDGGSDAWVWNGTSTVQVGLTGTGYSKSTGYRYSNPVAYHQAGLPASYPGLATGISRRYSSSDGDNGRDAWAWMGSTSWQIGYTGPGYSGSGGYQYSEPLHLHGNGQIIGISKQVSGGNTIDGHRLWVYDHQVPPFLFPLGLTTGYVGLSNRQEHWFGQRNEACQVTGSSRRYFNTGSTTSLGMDTWVWNGTTTVRINPTAGEYTSSGNVRNSRPLAQNEAGKVIGMAFHYNSAGTENGEDMFFWNGTTTTIIGLLDAAHTGSAGYRMSANSAVSGMAIGSTGRVIGQTYRILGTSTHNGLDTWVFDGAGTLQIGLTGGVYMGSNGYQGSAANWQDPTGRVAGISGRFGGVNDDKGYNAWVFDGTTTRQIGLTGGIYTSSTGYERTSPFGMNGRGHVAGVADRFSGYQHHGYDGFFWNGSTTVPIGLTGTPYTATNGFQHCIVVAMDEHDHVIGRQMRSCYTNGGERGWYFDAATGTTHDIGAGVPDLVRTSDNYSFLQPSYLTKEGIAIGVCYRYPGGVHPMVQHCFAYRPDLGFTDLGALIPGGLASAGWTGQSIAGCTECGQQARTTQIIGWGRVSTSTTERSVFAMTVPLANAAQNTSYGQACGGIALAVAPAPVSGNTLRYTTSNLPASCPLAAQVVSLVGIDPGIGLGHLGAPGCYQLVDPDFGATVYLGGRPDAVYSLTLPWAGGLIGLPLCSQSVALVPGTNALGVAFSNAVRSVVHWY